MAIVAHTHPFVIGVDTHARNHALAILASPNGEISTTPSFPPPPPDSHARCPGPGGAPAATST